MKLELTAVDYLGPMNWGVTSPQLFRADDGCLYVVKLCGNKLGVKALANESLAAILGERLGLCFPPAGTIWLDGRLLEKNRRLRKAARQHGPHFASRYLWHCRFVDRTQLHRAANRHQLAGVMLFDHLLHNVDRTHNRKNLLIRREEGRCIIYAIDHSHLFGTGRWTADSLRKLAGDLSVNTRRVYGLLLKHYLTTDDFDSHAAAVKALSDTDVSQTVAAIPANWLTDENDRLILTEHLIARRNLVDEIVARLTVLIPADRRRKQYVTTKAELLIPPGPDNSAAANPDTQGGEAGGGPYRCRPFRASYGPIPNRRAAVRESDLRNCCGENYPSCWFE